MTSPDGSDRVHELLKHATHGDSRATDELFPLVYAELRRIARGQMGREKPGQTLQATALVHEAYLRIVGQRETSWENRAHFFTAAAEAMRRILIERARRYGRVKHGAGRSRRALETLDLAVEADPSDVLALNDALTDLAVDDSRAADVVRLRFFAGLDLAEIASALGLSPRTVKREWSYARAWLHDALRDADSDAS